MKENTSKYPIYHWDIMQGTDAWRNLRTGKLTASHAQEIGNCGKGLDTYIMEVLAGEYSSGEVEFYKNKDMDRGTELEPSARAIYELENNVTLEQVGFIEYNDLIGCSPDGLEGEDVGVEIKCHADVGHFKMILNGADEIDTKYMWQIQMNLLITGRKLWKYIAYNPNFQKSLLVFDILPDKVMQDKLLAGFKLGEEKIKAIKSKIN